MRTRSTGPLVIALLALVLVASSSPAGGSNRAPRSGDNAPGGSEQGRDVGRSVNPSWIGESTGRFGCDLYRQVSSRDGNLFFSPYSISSALAMTLLGARGATESEMRQVLHLEQDGGHDAFSWLRETLADTARSAVTLEIANQLWGRSGADWSPEFLEACRLHYGAGLSQLDFAQDPEAARRTINEWCWEKTKGKIEDLLAPGTIGDLTQLVLTNAIYFKGDWAEPFEAEETREAPFYRQDGTESPTPFMHQVERHGYAETPDLQAIEMVYAGGDHSLFVLLPRDRGGLATVEAWLDPERLDALVRDLESRSVRVAFPRFRATSSFSLGETLSSMGMGSAFDPERADFSRMTTSARLFISEVVHKAFVEVNEEGTEAAAATGVVLEFAADVIEPPPVFIADHPFLYLIRHRATGAILFMGRLVDPGA